MSLYGGTERCFEKEAVLYEDCESDCEETDLRIDGDVLVTVPATVERPK